MRTHRNRQQCDGRSAVLGVQLLAFAVLSVMFFGCASEHRSPESALNDEGDRSAALVSMSVGFHKKADIALADNRREDAKAEISRLLELCYRYEVRTSEGDDTLYDAATRMARMQVEDNTLGDAEATARRALSNRNVQNPSLFRGYLHQTLADILEKKGDPHGAVDEHGKAIEVFKLILDARPRPTPNEATPTPNHE